MKFQLQFLGPISEKWKRSIADHDLPLHVKQDRIDLATSMGKGIMPYRVVCINTNKTIFQSPK